MCTSRGFFIYLHFNIQNKIEDYVVNYKELFNRIVLLISSPAKAWEEINEETDRQKVMSGFVYPMIGLCGLAVFVGAFFGNTAEANEAFTIAMRNCCATFISLFGGFFLAAYLSNAVIGKKLMKRTDEVELNRQFVGYAMVVVFALEIIGGLLSISFLHWILQFYTVFVVYEGARTLMKVDEQNLTRYSLMVSLCIIVCPAIISILFTKLSLILN